MSTSGEDEFRRGRPSSFVRGGRAHVAGCRAAVAALVGSGLTWLLAWFWATGDLSIGAPATALYCLIIAAIAVLAPWAIAVVERALLGGPTAAVERFVLAAGTTSMVFALITLVPAADVRYRWLLALGAAPVAVHVLIVAVVAEVDRGAAASLGMATAALGVVLVVVWSQKVHVGIGELVWGRSDQRLYAESAHQLIRAEFTPSRYPLGLPS